MVACVSAGWSHLRSHIFGSWPSVQAMHSLLLIHSSSVTSLTTMKAKVGFVTLRLPLLSLSLRNRPPDMFHLPWLWALLLSAQKNPPVCPDSYSSHLRENTDRISFSALHSWCSIWMAAAVSNMVMVLLGPASQIIYLTHCLYMPAGSGSGCKWSRIQVWHHAHFFPTNTGRKCPGSMEASQLLIYLWCTLLAETITFSGCILVTLPTAGLVHVQKPIPARKWESLHWDSNHKLVPYGPIHHDHECPSL